MEHDETTGAGAPSVADASAKEPAPSAVDDIEVLLEGVRDLPLREQVVVFEQVHTTLTDRLSEREA
ncbi:hypothetical protein OEB99_03525 [Actinotalea sp. M2MS4P-6]|uniref:hypothetical protein n=1 Tax=Actinotalea sp. M2MS4P-6 TaxID=2983762 RepID=UPI0021E5153E|nr:hypothetical protein [Actinotalea sp. M2MS4P-6]MCV2393369.1 hypothetical protein [Actinotalea sp. M2MS4P-6]